MLRSVRYSLLSKSKVFLFSNIAQTLYEVKIIFNSMSRRTPHVKTNKNARLKMPRRPAEARPFVMQMRSESVEVLPEPVRSPLDKKQYKTIKLQNGIVALLISDLNGGNSIESSDCEESATCEDSTDGSDNEYSDMSENESREGKEFAEEKMAACALSVGVGSFSDPADIQGMAHFVEHMVFMGSKKYPKENDFDSFIKKKGGSDNAATDCEITTFYFEVQEKHVGQALDKFSQFFVSPLMKQEAMQREREAIESEFAIATPSDSNRREQLLCSLFPEGHPLRTFSWGNLKSLKEMVPSDTYLHRQAHAFRDRHYSAHRMTVAIQARLELETLEQMVINTFGLVPSNHLPPADYTNYTYSRQLITTEFHSLYYMKPVNDAIELHLVWCMKEMMSLYKSKPHQYVSFLIGHEGPGSLLSYLKNKVWALGIYAGNNEDGIDYTSIHSLFSTQIVLTQEGYQHLDQVLAAVFSYIKMIQSVGPSPELFEEIKSIADTEHRYEQERQPSDNVEALVENMQLFPPEHFLVGDILYFNYDPQEIEYILNILSPETVNIIVLSKENTHVGKKIEYDATEQWFGTEYKRIEIPPEWKQAWRNIKPYEEFHTPPENIYISTNFDLIPVPTDQRLEGKIVSVANPHSKREQKTYVCKSTDDAPRIKSKKNISPYDPVVYGKGALARTNYNQPHLLRKDDRMEVWYKPDYKFRLPNAFMYFYFLTSLSVKTAKDNCLLDLWSVMLNHDLREAVYAANMAGLSHNVYMSDKGLILKAEGYNQKLHLLVDVITLRMRECSGALTPAMFTAIKDSQSKLYYNQGIKPGKLAKELRLSILLEPYCSTLKRLRALESVTFSDLQTFGDRFLDNLYAQVLVQGNLSEEEALAVADLVQRNVAWKGLPEEHIPKVVACELPRSVQICRVSSLNTKDTNSVITNYYQSNLFNWRENAIIEVLMMLMEEPVFDTLRTKEQLGYSVFCQHRYSSGVLGYSLTVNTQADKYSESHVDERIETFLKSFAKDIRKLDERELAETKESLIKLKQTVDVELKEEVSRNWGEITAMEYTFDRLQREVAAIQRVTLADLKEWFKQHSGRGSNYRKLSVQVVGHSNKSNNESQTTPPETNGKTSPAQELHFLSDSVLDNGHGNLNFILNVQTYRENLPLYPDITFWKFKYNPKVKLKLKQTVDVELKEEVSRNWGEITAMEYTFDRLQREVAAIQRVTLADLKEWFKQHSGRGSNYRKLSVQVVGHSNKSNNESQTTPPETNGKTSPAQELHFLSDSVLDNGHGNLNFILNVQTYRENLPLYPDITVKLDNC